MTILQSKDLLCPEFTHKLGLHIKPEVHPLTKYNPVAKCIKINFEKNIMKIWTKVCGSPKEEVKISDTFIKETTFEQALGKEFLK